MTDVQQESDQISDKISDVSSISDLKEVDADAVLLEEVERAMKENYVAPPCVFAKQFGSNEVADLHARIRELSADNMRLRNSLESARKLLTKFKNERDFHRMGHSRVVEEKQQLVLDLKRIRSHYEQYEPTLAELRQKYEAVMKSKMLVKLENDRLKNRVQSMSKQAAAQNERQGSSVNFAPESNGPSGAVPGADEASNKTQSSSKKTTTGKIQGRTSGDASASASSSISFSALPPRKSSFSRSSVDGTQIDVLDGSSKGGLASVAGLKQSQLYSLGKPCGRVCIEGSNLVAGLDDGSWKLFRLDTSSTQAVLTGRGHSAFVSGVALGSESNADLLVTSAGDGEVRLWSLTKGASLGKFTDHTQCVWSVEFLPHGSNYVLTASMDQSAKLIDVTAGKSKQSFRGHVDSVNSATFSPEYSLVATASADKTVSLWDVRTSHCVKTFYDSHVSSVVHASFSLDGKSLATCDLAGQVCVFDLCKLGTSRESEAHRCSFRASESSGVAANTVALDCTGSVVFVGCSDKTVAGYMVDGLSLGSGQGPAKVVELVGHDSGVQSLFVSRSRPIMASAGDDMTCRVWKAPSA